MKGLFKSFFTPEKETRVLEHPRDLQQNDIIKFRFLPQTELSNKQFQISQINTYDYEDRKLTEFQLQGSNDEAIFFTVDETDDVPFLAITRKIQREMVERLFDLDEFANVFDDEGHTRLTRKTEPEALANWTAEQYTQEIYAEVGYFHKGDYRNQEVPEAESEGDCFENYLLIDDSRQFVIEAEVYEGGETDILVSIRRPLTDIDEMWPAEASPK